MAKANKHILAELENRIRFETLISDISARFVRLPSDTVDGEIERALKQVLVFFEVDRCGMLGVHADKEFVWLTHACYAEGVEPISKEINLAELFPWTYRKLTKGLSVSVGRLSELPSEAEHDRLSCLATGVKSYLSTPLFCSQGIRYLLAIQSLRNERDWPKEFIPRLTLLGEVFVNALERRNTDQALRESESRLNLAADSAGAGLWTLDIATGTFWLTEKTRELFGFPPDSKISFEQYLNVVYPADRERIRQAVDHAQQSKEKTFVQYRIIRPDRSIRWMVSRGRIHSGVSDETHLFMGVTIDITERKQLQDEVKKAAEEWQITFDTIQDLIMVLDCEFKIIRTNRATESFLGLPPDKILGRPCHILMHMAGMPFESCPAAKALKTKQHEEAEVYFDQKNVWLLISATPIFDDQGRITGFIHTAKDMTERKRAEEELLRLREEYTHIARVSAMGELTASLAHELKQPLAAIRSNAQSALRFLAGDQPDIDELHEILQDIIIDNRRADDVIGKVRVLMRKSEFQITELNMKELIQDILPLVTSHKAMRKISLDVELDDTIPLVAGDRIQLQQVILNLILNSSEALMNIKTESRSILVRAYQQNTRTVTLSVKDNGPGIEAKAMPHVFEAFYTTKSEGLGMGLAICRSIVENHGGRLWAENNPDGGAAFYFTIPIAREKSK